MHCEDTPIGNAPTVRHESYRHGPQLRGTVGTHRVVWKSHRHRGHPPTLPEPTAMMTATAAAQAVARTATVTIPCALREVPQIATATIPCACLEVTQTALTPGATTQKAPLKPQVTINLRGLTALANHLLEIGSKWALMHSD